MLTRRKTLLAASAVAMPFVSTTGWAQAYPNKPVKIVVAFPAGGPTDAHARMIAPWLSDQLGQQFVVENRSGAGGMIGTEAVVRSAPDGYTIQILSTAEMMAQASYEKLNFNITRDLQAIGPISRGPLLLVCNPAFPVKTVAELIAHAKSRDGRVTYASVGVGTPQHVGMELFKMSTGINMIHVPYSGSAPALTDLIGGQVDVMFDAITSTIEHVRSGRLRLLAAASPMPLKALPGAPLVAETLPGFEIYNILGVMAPKGTPDAIVSLLNKVISEGVAVQKNQAWLESVGREPMTMPAAQYNALVASEVDKWAKVVKFANIKAE
jgi:tripartite-type tricarboxylate transporter receptor subunit TctC